MPPAPPEYAADAPIAGPSAALPARPRLIAPHYLALAGIAQISLDRLLPLVLFAHLPWSQLGWLPITAGIGIQIAAYRRFRAHRTPVMPGRRSTALVTGGVYRFTRNPMYLGMVFILVGGVIIGGSLSSVVVPPLFAWVIQRRLIEPEENALTARFGAAYDDYRQRVRRWI